LPSSAHLGKDFEEAVGLACESAAAGQAARQFGAAAVTAPARLESGGVAVRGGPARLIRRDAAQLHDWQHPLTNNSRINLTC